MIKLVPHVEHKDQDVRLLFCQRFRVHFSPSFFFTPSSSSWPPPLACPLCPTIALGEFVVARRRSLALPLLGPPSLLGNNALILRYYRLLGCR
jgi:hypothetical protein